MDFASRLRRARRSRGLRLCDLDREARLTKGHSSQIEKRQRTELYGATISGLAGALGVSMDWLWNGKEFGGPIGVRCASCSRPLQLERTGSDDG